MCAQPPAFNAFAVMRHNKHKRKRKKIYIYNDNNNNNKVVIIINDNKKKKMSLKKIKFLYEFPFIRGATINHTGKKLYVRVAFSAWFGNSYFSPKQIDIYGNKV